MDPFLVTDSNLYVVELPDSYISVLNLCLDSFLALITSYETVVGIFHSFLNHLRVELFHEKIKAFIIAKAWPQ